MWDLGIKGGSEQEHFLQQLASIRDCSSVKSALCGRSGT